MRATAMYGPHDVRVETVPDARIVDVNSQDSGDTFGSPLRLLGLRWRRDDEGGANPANSLAAAGVTASGG